MLCFHWASIFRRKRKRIKNCESQPSNKTLLPVYKSNFFFFSSDTHSHHDGNLHHLFCHRQHPRLAVRKILALNRLWKERLGSLFDTGGPIKTLPTLNDFQNKWNQNEMNDNSHIPATVLVALLQLFKSWPMHHIGLKPNCADRIQLSETVQIIFSWKGYFKSYFKLRERDTRKDTSRYFHCLVITCFQHFQRTCWRFSKRKSLESGEARKVSWSKRSIL